MGKHTREYALLRVRVDNNRYDYTRTACACVGCNNKKMSRGVCSAHYDQAERDFINLPDVISRAVHTGIITMEQSNMILAHCQEGEPHLARQFIDELNIKMYMAGRPLDYLLHQRSRSRKQFK